MKKSLIAICGAVLALASFAEPEAPAEAPAQPPKHMERRERPNRANRPAPTMLKLDANTTPEQVETFKKQVAEKIDAAVAAQAAKTGDDKAPTTIVLFVNDRPIGMGMGQRGGQRGPGMGQRGPGQGGRRGPGQRGPRGNRPAEAPEPAPAE